MADLSVTGEVVVTSEKAEAAFDRVGDKATQMANEVTTSAGKAGQAVDGMGDSAEKSAEKFTRADSLMRAAIMKSTRELELLGKTASQRFEAQIDFKGLEKAKFQEAILGLQAMESALSVAKAREAEFAAQNAFSLKAAQAKELVKASEYARWWAQELEKVEAAEKRLAGQNSFIASLKSQADAIGKTKADLLEMQAAQMGVATQAAPFIAKMREAEAGVGKMGISAAQTAAALRGVPAQFTDIVTSLQGGQAPLTVLLQQGGQLKDMFGGAGAAAKALGGYVLGLVNPFTLAAVAVGGLGLAYAAGSKEADGYRQALVLTGNQAGATVGQMQQMAQQIAVVTGSQREAAAALATFASSGKVGQENLRQFTKSAIEFSRVTGQSIDEVAKNFADLANDPLKATLKLNESMNFLTESIFRQIQSLQEQGRETEAANVAQKAYADTMNERKDEIVRNLGLIEKAWAAIKKEAGYAMDAFLDIGRSKTLETRLEKAQAALASYQGTLPGKRTAEQVSAVREFGGEEGLKREIAGLQELIENQRKSAQMERERAAAVKASGELAQGALKYESDLEKQRREVLSATEKYETALKNQNLTQEQRNRLEADYIKLVSGVTAVKEKSGRSSNTASENKELRDQLRVFADLAGLSSTYYAELANYQKQRANGVITEQQYVQAVETLIQKQPFAVAAAKAHADAIKDEAKAAAASAKALSAWYEVRERESQGLQNQINARREDVALMGLSAEAVAEYTHAKYEQLAAEKEAYAAALESASFYAGEYAEAYKAAAEAALQQAKQLRELGNLEVEKVSKGAAKKAADEWQRTADQINQSLTDALMRGFESGKDFAKNMRDTIVNMFKTMVLRPIISAIVMPFTGAIAGAFGLAGSANAGQGGMGGIGLLGSLATSPWGSAALGWAGGMGGFGAGMASAASEMALGSAFVGPSATAAGGSIGAGATFAQALPYLGLALGAISLLGSFDKSGTPHYGASATYEGGKVSGDEAAFLANRGISGRYSASAQSGVNSIAMGAGMALDAMDRTFGGKGGYAVTTAYSDDSSDDPGFGSLRITRNGEKVTDWGDTRTSKWADKIFADGAEGAKMYADAVATDVRDAMLDIDLPSWARDLLTEIGDNVSMEQLSVVVQQIGVIKETFDQLGATLTGFADLTDEARKRILDASGSIEALAANAGTFYQNFYTEGERTDIAKKQVRAQLDALGVDIDLDDPEARAKYRALVESQLANIDKEGAPELYAALLKLSGAFAAVTTSADDAAEAAKRQAEQAAKQAEQELRSAYDTLRRAIDRDRKDLQAQASSLSEAISGISSAVDLLKSNARDLYGEVDSTQQMLAAQGMVYIENALEGVRAGASVADYTGLSDAISAARGGISSGAYQSEFERQRDTLVLAGQLSELGELGDMQLSVEERQLRAINEQLEYLDKLAQQADELINGTAALTGTVDSYFAQLLALLDKDGRDGESGGSGSGGGGSGGFAIGGSGPGDSGGGGTYVPPTKSEEIRTQFRGYDPQSTEDLLKAYNASLYFDWTIKDIADAYGVGEEDMRKLFEDHGIPAFATGINRVPHDMVARIHKDEAVVPARFNPFNPDAQQFGNNGQQIDRLVVALTEQNARLEARLAAIEANSKRQADQFESYSNGGTFSRQKVMA